ncbi:lysophospholipase PLB [Acrasis kona]|uniref:lysophospholipase n=1 Tax=Acrasis kona TaxID=1008807 RepID=A0AAW2YXV4_9EUKA
MKTAIIAVTTVTLLCSLAFIAINPAHRATKILAHSYAGVSKVGRKISSSPTGNYAPATVTCPPNTPLIRSINTGLSANETSYLSNRQPVVQSAWRTYLTQAAIPGFNIDNFLSNTTSTGKVGIAFSGGGFRAMLNGASVFNALDSRNQDAVNLGTGGVVQLATYMTGLSGGSFLVGSLAINNFPRVTDLTKTWDLSESVLAPSRANIFENAGYYGRIIRDVNDKEEAGFDTSITDLWARAIGQKLVASSNPTPNSAITYSDIRNTSSFVQGQMPFPIIIALGRSQGQLIIPANSTVYEFNPFEFGSWSPRIRAFTPIQYLGTNLTNGRPTLGNNRCVEGFDNFGFSVGTSSSIFNQGLLQLNQSSSSILGSIIERILTRIGQKDNDIASYPNTFYGYEPGVNPVANDVLLDLVDGGEDNENIPFVPILQKVRGVNTIIAVDSSADTLYNWPNGSSLVQTYQASLDPLSENTIPFPPVPSVETFINLKLNTRMTFFGCPNASNPNSYPNGTYPYPLVIYLPNYPYTMETNSSTFNFRYDDNAVNGFFENGFTQLQNISNIKVCLACGTIQRSSAAKGIPLPSACQACFDEFCWNGERDDRTPPIYNPRVQNPRGQTSGAEHKITISIAVGVLISVCAYFFVMVQ